MLDCCICLRCIQSTPITLDPCMHSFCKSCIDSWFKVNRTCPLCRTPVTLIIKDKELKKHIRAATIRCLNPYCREWIVPNQFLCHSRECFSFTLAPPWRYLATNLKQLYTNIIAFILWIKQMRKNIIALILCLLLWSIVRYGNWNNASPLLPHYISELKSLGKECYYILDQVRQVNSLRFDPLCDMKKLTHLIQYMNLMTLTDPYFYELDNIYPECNFIIKEMFKALLEKKELRGCVQEYGVRLIVDDEKQGRPGYVGTHWVASPCTNIPKHVFIEVFVEECLELPKETVYCSSLCASYAIRIHVTYDKACLSMISIKTPW